LLIPIETLVPFGQAPLDEAIRTFHAPSKLAAAAGVVTDIPKSKTMRVAMIALQNCPMAIPL
jgi:hypothetical protein